MFIDFNGERIDCSDEYSCKDFTGKIVNLLDGINVYGSCFSQDTETAINVFPENMTGVTFLNCNLHGCIIPMGNNVRNT